jgi:putative membrane protein
MEAPAHSELTSATTELAARRTGMAFQRTRLSADRTLMAVIRTALALISFGFTIQQAFHHLYEAHLLTRSAAPRHFGEALAALGVLMLVLGIAYHVAFMLELRRQRTRMRLTGLVYAESEFPVSMTLIVALALLAIGVLAVSSMLFHYGPFG